MSLRICITCGLEMTASDGTFAVCLVAKRARRGIAGLGRGVGRLESNNDLTFQQLAPFLTLCLGCLQTQSSLIFDAHPGLTAACSRRTETSLAVTFSCGSPLSGVLPRLSAYGRYGLVRLLFSKKEPPGLREAEGAPVDENVCAQPAASLRDGLASGAICTRAPNSLNALDVSAA